MPNMNQMMQQARKMQQQLAEAQASLQSRPWTPAPAAAW